MLKGSDRFFKVYSGVPDSEKKVPIAVINNTPINWNLAYEEIKNETEKGKKILKILIDLDII